MFYNSKKLIDEKVLQQYFFERFMTADGTERAPLLPAEFIGAYSQTSSIKCLRPEVSLAPGFMVDFVLYPINSKSEADRRQPLFIELKWKSSDFAKQTSRHEWFDGTSGRGFLVVVKHDKELPSGIPVVELEVDDFQRWFVEQSSTIVGQALHRKLGTPATRPSGVATWLVYVGRASLSHYIDSGIREGIWAFKDRNPPNRIMRILEGDRIVFVRPGFSRPPRMFVADNEPSEGERKSVHNERLYSNDQIDWELEAIDTFSVSKGYHLDFTSCTPYDVFESEVWRAAPDPTSKTYTQFVRFSTDSGASYLFSEHAPAGHVLKRSMFPAKSKPLKAFVNAIRTAAANRGDVVQVSDSTYRALRSLLP